MKRRKRSEETRRTVIVATAANVLDGFRPEAAHPLPEPPLPAGLPHVAAG